MSATQHATRRLSDALVPRHYEIHLDASPKRASFSGEVVLDAKLTSAQPELWLHARDMKITAAHVQQGGRSRAVTCRLHPAEECISLHAAGGFGKGAVRITLQYKGRLQSSMHGLYLAKDGPETAIVSQCEASDARAMVPCLDEPGYKAQFTWQITTDAGLTVITNGRARGHTSSGKKTLHRFAKTAKMSTYLLAVTIGTLEAGPTKKVAGTPCRIFAGVGKKDQAGFAMEVTAKVLPWYITYFGQPYAYGKLDQVAVPGFDAGAMENAGAIFYRQSLLLMQAAHTSRGAQKRIAEVIAHEIAHQWFGNLVTMQWWDDLWLNEAFATWIAYKVCDEMWPEWHIWHDYLDGKEAALAADALPSTHPIYAEVRSPAEATELFDVITYEKGCGVLRMAERYLGTKVFRRGIRRYIAANAFGNAQGADLWRHLSEASGEPVDQLMHQWIHTPGFPLLTCTLKTIKGEEMLHVRQSRFADQTGAEQTSATADETRWITPLVIAYDAGDGKQEHRVLLREQEALVRLPSKGGKKLRYAYPNDDATGFFRLQLDDGLRRRLLHKNNTQSLSVSSRMAIVSDQWALCRAGYGGVEAALDAFAAFGRDDDPSVFRAIAGRLRAISAHVLRDADRPAFAAFVGELGHAHLKRLGNDWQKKRPAHEAVFFSSVLDVLGFLARDEDILQQARAWQLHEAEDATAVDANLAGSIVALSTVAQGLPHAKRLLAEYQRRKTNKATPEMQGRYLGALCAFEAKQPVAFVLDAALSGEVPQEQLRSVVGALLSQRKAGSQTWAFLKDHWQDIGPKVGAMGLARLVEATGSLPYSKRADVQKFFRSHPVPEAERALKKSAEAMALWQGLRQREADPLSRWLQKR